MSFEFDHPEAHKSLKAVTAVGLLALNVFLLWEKYTDSPRISFSANFLEKGDCLSGSVYDDKNGAEIQWYDIPADDSSHGTRLFVSVRPTEVSMPSLSFRAVEEDPVDWLRFSYTDFGTAAVLIAHGCEGVEQP